MIKETHKIVEFDSYGRATDHTENLDESSAQSLHKALNGGRHCWYDDQWRMHFFCEEEGPAPYYIIMHQDVPAANAVLCVVSPSN